MGVTRIPMDDRRVVHGRLHLSAMGEAAVAATETVPMASVEECA
jgi:hypothetical protein